MKTIVKYSLVAAALITAAIVTEASSPGAQFAEEFPELMIYLAKRFAYIYLAVDYGTTGLDALAANLEKFVLLNPDPNQPIILDIIRFFVSILQPFYVLAITVTGFYWIFASASPAGRAKAKSTLIKLFVSLTLISFTPIIMYIFLDLVHNIASSVLAQSDVSYFTTSLVSMVDKLKYAHWFFTFIDIEFGYFFWLPIFLTVWGLYIILLLRFFAVILWIVFLPVSIFLYSFNFTKTMGRNMLEQTILWSVLQILNAVIIAVTTIGLRSRPTPSFMQIDVLMITYNIDALLIMGIMFLMIAPILMLVWFRNFLP